LDLHGEKELFSAYGFIVSPTAFTRGGLTEFFRQGATTPYGGDPILDEEIVYEMHYDIGEHECNCPANLGRGLDGHGSRTVRLYPNHNATGWVFRALGVTPTFGCKIVKKFDHPVPGSVTYAVIGSLPSLDMPLGARSLLKRVGWLLTRSSSAALVC
jgi:hypothetical protein